MGTATLAHAAHTQSQAGLTKEDGIENVAFVLDPDIRRHVRPRIRPLINEIVTTVSNNVHKGGYDQDEQGSNVASEDGHGDIR